ncbi:MAG TPA: sigma-70 family RNA polymerase sigma factor [Balneolales bacterium]|nr:sigma-70 family RNA polymerase sigma factor [Balneolales bacterium]
MTAASNHSKNISPVSSEEENHTASESSREDAILVEQAISGDEKAYNKIVEKYHRALYYHISKMIRNNDIVEDLIQEIFSKAFSNIGSYNTNYAFSTWLYRIATNHTIDYLRKKKLNTYSIDEPISTKGGDMKMELPDETQKTDDMVIRKQRHNIIKEAMRQLPDKYRRVIEMRHMEEKSYQEIADILDLPLGTVKAHIFRARELLYKYLKDKRGSF